MENKLVIISGNLATGKTSLAVKLSNSLNWFLGYESISDNPYLIDYYSNVKGWAYHLEIYFLGHRANQHILACKSKNNAVLDRSIYEDAQIFAKALYHQKLISSRDYNSYLTIFNLIVDNLTVPNLIVYLKASTNVILERVKKRGYEFDKNISSDYVEIIARYYDKWTSNFSLCPVLTIDTDSFDFVNDIKNFEHTKNLILSKL